MLLSLSMAEILSHPREDHSAHSRLAEHLVDEGTIFGRQFGQGGREFIGNGELRREHRRIPVLEGV
jgi:hypothetical protein